MQVATRIARYQLLIAVVLATLWWLFSGHMPGFAALVGGLIGAALTLYTGVHAFAGRSADPQDMLRRFMRAQARKWVLAIVLFALAFKGLPDHALPLMTSFVATLAVYWFALLWDDKV